MATLAPNPSFNPMQVSWGGPEEVRTKQCSYCDAPLTSKGYGLVLCREDGWVAEFCDRCSRTHFGVRKP